MRTASLLALVLALAVTGCKKDKKPEGGGGSAGSQTTDTTGSAGSGSAAGSAGSADSGSGSGSAVADSGSGSGSAAAEVKMSKGAGNCPSTVLGAETKAEVKGADVVLTITATDKDAIAAVQRRTKTLLEEKADGPTSGATHDQKGTHGGGTGLCPVYWTEGGKAAAKDDAKGVTITITPKEKPEELKGIIDGRITKAAAWVKENVKPGDQGNQGGVGGGAGEHGSKHAGSGDGKGKERDGKGGTGGGAGTGGGGGKGTGGGNKTKAPDKGSATDTGGGGW